MHDMINSSWIDPSKYPTRVFFALFENFLQWAFDNQVMIKKPWKIVPSKKFVGSTSVLQDFLYFETMLKKRRRRKKDLILRYLTSFLFRSAIHILCFYHRRNVSSVAVQQTSATDLPSVCQNSMYWKTQQTLRRAQSSFHDDDRTLVSITHFSQGKEVSFSLMRGTLDPLAHSWGCKSCGQHKGPFGQGPYALS